MHKNAEGYTDQTAGQAISNITKQHKEKVIKKEEDRKNVVMKLIKDLISLSGFELVERIHIKSSVTGKDYL